MNRRLRRLSLSAIAVLIAVGTVSPLRSSAAATPTLQDLQGVAELKTLFNRDAGSVRLVMLVSPT